MPKSVSEHFTREALFALERCQKGKGSPVDYALVASQVAREAALFANQEAKEWTRIFIGAIPGNSSGAGSSSYSVCVPSSYGSPYAPQ